MAEVSSLVPAASGPAPPATPVGLSVMRTALPAGMSGAAITVPFGLGVGAAAFRAGNSAYVAFDEQRPLDMAGLSGDLVFGAASVTLAPAATLLQIPLAQGSELRLQHLPTGWLIVVARTAPPLAPIIPHPLGADLVMPATSPGHVVSIQDPDSGAPLLVGTQRQSGQGIAVGQTEPQFALRPTWQGIVAEPYSDQVELRSLSDRFVLALPATAPLPAPVLPDVNRALAEAAVLTHRYDFPDLPRERLRRRLQAELLSSAESAPLERFRPRLQAAQTMIALGMGSEAQAVLQLARADNPQAASTPDFAALGSIAALLAGRVQEAQGLEDPALTGCDELALWRAVRDAMRDPSSASAARLFSIETPLILAYPEALRHALLPLAAETMAQGGELPAAQVLVSRFSDEPGLAYARALVLQAQGRTDLALAQFDNLASSRDRLESARAREAAVELRLKTGRIDAATAADLLERQFSAWRGDGRELTLRLRAADLRIQSGGIRQALASLREAQTLYPEAPEIRTAMANAFTHMLAGNGAASTSPLDLVALVDENADLLPSGAEGEKLAPVLADKLVALDLPRRAEPLLAKLAAQAATPAARANFGLRLAELYLEDDDARGALDALAGSTTPNLPRPLYENRELIRGRALARQGDMKDASQVLVALGTPAADELRARLLSDAKDWGGADAALRDLAAKTVPSNGELAPAQRQLLLQWASAASQAGDEASLRELQAKDGDRMGIGPDAEMFRLLTGGPVTGVADLKRVAQETQIAKGIPAAMKTLSAN